MYKLVISDDQGHATVVPLLRDEVTIGREQGNSIRLTERNVSRSHARLMRRNGSYVLEDLGSYNGVTVNGERIDANAKLASGDQLGIGDYGLAFQSDVAATANTMPSPEPKSQPPPRLVVLSEPAAGAEFTLTKTAMRIGRDERLDIWINHKSISHEHAEVQVVDGNVTVFDLESANGMRVNGVGASRAILESGDVLQLGEVRFRFVPPQGAHSLDPLPHTAPELQPSRASRKPLFAVAVVGLLVLAVVGAVLTTGPAGTAKPMPLAEPPLASRQPAEAAADEELTEQEDSADDDSAGRPIEEPREWEELLARARKALSKGRFDRAYSIANELPVDSVLRRTPEFGEIRYRYAQAHINAAEEALEEGDLESVRGEARLVLDLKGITTKQRQDARRMLRAARDPEARTETAANREP